MRVVKLPGRELISICLILGFDSTPLCQDKEGNQHSRPLIRKNREVWHGFYTLEMYCEHPGKDHLNHHHEKNIIWPSEKKNYDRATEQLAIDQASSTGMFDPDLQKMAFKNRKILRFMDQCAAHTKNLDTLKNVHVEFLPANSTSVLQSLDQGIIRTVKHMYRKHMLTASWDFGFSTVSEELPVVSLDTVEESDSIWAEVKERLGVTSKFNDYVKDDNNLLPCEGQEIENFCKSMRVIEASMEQRWNEWARETGEPEKTRRPAASSGTIPTCKNLMTQQGLNPVCLGGRSHHSQFFPSFPRMGSGSEMERHASKMTNIRQVSPFSILHKLPQDGERQRDGEWVCPGEGRVDVGNPTEPDRVSNGSLQPCRVALLDTKLISVPPFHSPSILDASVNEGQVSQPLRIWVRLAHVSQALLQLCTTLQTVCGLVLQILSDKMEWSIEKQVQFIEEYRSAPALWNPSKVIEVNMERHRNEGVGEMGDPRAKIHRPTASFGTIPTCQNLVTQFALVEASMLIAQSLWTLLYIEIQLVSQDFVFSMVNAPINTLQTAGTICEMLGSEMVNKSSAKHSFHHQLEVGGADSVVSTPFLRERQAREHLASVSHRHRFRNQMTSTRHPIITNPTKNLSTRPLHCGLKGNTRNYPVSSPLDKTAYFTCRSCIFHATRTPCPLAPFDVIVMRNETLGCNPLTRNKGDITLVTHSHKCLIFNYTGTLTVVHPVLQIRLTECP
ncbi:hypothetical protein PR048_019146 [Dryococelus australis]|uniref:DDE-1 domain-containing protein n=1 Tax=Dryococelus australis TaxID=614101 RepID=A0ABQ9H2R0_9NEOP|nr:hypothetical protein PR048_019146 [Dryococelus australis]